MRTFKVQVGICLLVLLALGMFSEAHGAKENTLQGKKFFLPLLITPCWPDSMPVGTISGQPRPVFCNNFSHGTGTSVESANAWQDSFDHGLSFADFSQTNYKIFESVGYVYETQHWRHANHWMVDLASHAPKAAPREVRGGGLMRPDRTFRFEGGKLVVEAEVAAGIEEYEGNAWPELVISTGSQPHDIGSLYAYDQFPEDWTLGCRLQASRYPVCAFKSNNGDLQAGEGSQRLWEMSAHQDVGTDNFGGSPFEGRDSYWRLCSATDADEKCRDHFRLELTQTSLALYVNGHRYFEQKGIPPLPQELLSADIYVYFASMAVSHPAEAIRFHWDSLSVNPQSLSTAQEAAALTSSAESRKDCLGNLLK